MMLKAIAPGVVIRIAPKVRQDEECGVAGVFRFGLDGLPYFGAQPVGPPDAINVERESSGVGDINIVHGDPQQAGRHLPHQLARDIHREFVRT